MFTHWRASENGHKRKGYACRNNNDKKGEISLLHRPSGCQHTVVLQEEGGLGEKDRHIVQNNAKVEILCDEKQCRGQWSVSDFRYMSCNVDFMEY